MKLNMIHQHHNHQKYKFYHYYLSTKQNPVHNADVEFAQRLYRELESRGREPWLDWQEVPFFQ